MFRHFFSANLLTTLCTVLLATAWLASNALAQSTQYSPAKGEFATLAIEDQWGEAQNDEDYNEMVTKYNYTFVLDQFDLVEEILLTLQILAHGGDYKGGVALRLPLGQNTPATITRLFDTPGEKTIQNGVLKTIPRGTAVDEVNSLVIQLVSHIHQDIFPTGDHAHI